jgi:hypothetical protein
VFLAGIVGVPWQDVSDAESWTDPKRLRYLTSEELEKEGRWDWILGKDGGPPTDALMVETPVDRTTLAISQTHPAPAVGATLSPASTTSLANPINGHETNIPDGRELQYACIFPLNEPETCDGSGQSCDCTADDAKYNRALCQGNVQTHAKAYPGTRQLEVLREFGRRTQNSIVASICPKVSVSADPAADPDYGYNPAVRAIIDRVSDSFKRKCLPRPLEADTNGQVPCAVVEARRKDANGMCAACDGLSAGRRALASGELDPAVRQRLALEGYCGKDGPIPCDEFCLCEIEQLAGEDLRRCQTDPEALGDAEGYCYVDAEPGPGEAPDDPAVALRAASVGDCPASQRRLLRFSSGVPASGAVAFVACLGKSLH